MACCKTAGAACHRSSDQTNNPHWANHPSCPTGCDRKIGLPSLSNTALAANYGDSGPTAAASLLTPAESLTLTPYRSEFGLFARPPPSFPASRG
jgi:hypothetical protein